MAPLPDAVAQFLAHYHEKRPSETTAPAPAFPIDPSDSVIEAFNRAHSVPAILESNGYRRIGKRWLAPQSESGLPGVVILDGRAFSHHGSDPLADGHSHDAFDLFTMFEHQGDVRAAARAAAESLGIAHRPKVNTSIEVLAEPVREWSPNRRASQLGRWRAQFDHAMGRI
jgi:putative DNA primase/helicase